MLLGLSRDRFSVLVASASRIGADETPPTGGDEGRLAGGAADDEARPRIGAAR